MASHDEREYLIKDRTKHSKQSARKSGEEGGSEEETSWSEESVGGRGEGGEVEGQPNLDNDKKVIIVIAGKPRNGKSRALNNIFHVEFDSKCSASSVTKTLIISRVSKEGKQLIIIDTPGLGASDIPLKEVKKDFEHVIDGLNYTLLLCHSVGPNNILSDADKVVLKNLHKMCGSRVWKHCVVLFSFSDTLREQEFSCREDRDGFLDMLREHAEKLSNMLRKTCEASIPDVKVVLDENIQPDNIVAVPVGLKYKDKKEKHYLLPYNEIGKDWRDCAFSEILRKSTPLEQVSLLTVTHGATTVSGVLTGAGVGAMIGGFTGAVVGLLAGGVTAIPAAASGAVAGGVAGAVGAAGAGGAVILKTKKVREEKARKLGEGDYRSVSPQDQLNQAQLNQETISPSPSTLETAASPTLEGECSSKSSLRSHHTHPTTECSHLLKASSPSLPPEQDS